MAITNADIPIMKQILDIILDALPPFKLPSETRCKVTIEAVIDIIKDKNDQNNIFLSILENRN